MIIIIIVTVVVATAYLAESFAFINSLYSLHNPFTGRLCDFLKVIQLGSSRVRI